MTQEVLYDFPTDGARKNLNRRIKRQKSSTGNKLEFAYVLVAQYLHCIDATAVSLILLLLY